MVDAGVEGMRGGVSLDPPELRRRGSQLSCRIGERSITRRASAGAQMGGGFSPLVRGRTFSISIKPKKKKKTDPISRGLEAGQQAVEAMGLAKKRWGMVAEISPGSRPDPNANHNAATMDAAARWRNRRLSRDEIMAKAAADGGLDDEPVFHPWYLFNPRRPFINLWNMLSSVVLVYIALFTPFEVAFIEPPTTMDDPLFILGRVVDIIFLIDMLLQFVTMIPRAESDSKKESKPAMQPGTLDDRWPVIVSNYLQGWFLLDLISLGASSFDYIPFLVMNTPTDDMARNVSLADAAADSERLSILASFRVVRVLRLIKLARLLKASRRLKDWFTQIPTPRATVTIINLLTRCKARPHGKHGCLRIGPAPCSSSKRMQACVRAAVLPLLVLLTPLAPYPKICGRGLLPS